MSKKSAEQIYGEFHGKVVVVIRTSGEKWIGVITLTVGPKPPATILGIDIISDVVAYKKDIVNYQFKHRILPPEEIEIIRLFDESDEPVFMDYNAFSNLLSGQSPTAFQEVFNHIQNGRTYVVNFDGKDCDIVLANNGGLTLKLRK